MKKVGIMGGTFNPIHNAHIAMAQAAYEQYDLDEVWFMPSKNPPHKENDDIVSEEHRKRMIQFAINDIPYFSFSDIELKREGVTYTSDTLKELTKHYKDTKFYFILGGDSLENFHKWHEPKKITKLCTILAVPRNGINQKQLKELCEKNNERLNGDFRPISMNTLSISSEQLRKKIEKGISVSAYCPDKVNRYIQFQELYGCQLPEISKNDILKFLESSLRPKRYRHTLGVAYTATNLAFCHGVLAKKAELAGLLHDCAKFLTDAEMIDICNKNKIELTDIELKNTALIHQKLGAYLAKDKYGINDEEVLNAITVHTTGKPAMSTLEKIIYIADYIEPGRKMEVSPYSLDTIRKECFHDLDNGLLMILENTVSFLMSYKNNIDNATMQTYEYYKKKGKENHE